jgi:uncharacterized protein (UPF0332 family)
LKPTEFLAKAKTAVRSARVLLAAGDPDGACNRAYYAMFDAARAALLDAELGRALNRAHQVRMIADYTGDPVDHDTAEHLVSQAAECVTAIAKRFG